MNQSVGEQLKAAREAKHLSLEQAAQSTFIRIKFLEALENDRREELHTSAQARGFLRMYADLLGIPAGPLLDAWDGVVTEDESQPVNVEQQETTPPEVESIPETVSPAQVGQNDRFLVAEELEDAPTLPVDALEETAALTSDDVFREIGRVLRKRRENLKITYADIEKFVHIRPKYLEALEEGRLDELPSTVQGRGMLSNYAHFLEVDNNLLQLRFAEGLQLRRLELNPPAVVKKADKSEPAPEKSSASKSKPAGPSILKRSLTPDLLIGGALILLLFGFALWSTFRVISMRNGSEELAAPDISSVLLDTSIPRTLIPVEATVEATSAMAQEATLQAATQAASNEFASAQEAAPEGDQPLNINVVARQNAWLRVTVGKSVVFNGRVVAGNAYPFSGNERLELLTGNAAAVQVFYNGTDLGSLGLNGQVASLIFTLDGIITPTPRFSPTPTATIQATLTAQPTSTPPAATLTPLIPVK